MATLRDVGAVGIKLLGVSYLARSVLAGLSLVVVRFAPAEFSPGDGFGVAQAVGALGYPLAALLLLGAGDELARRLFSDHEMPGDFNLRTVAVVGVALLGVATAIEAVPALLEVFGLAVYYAEGSRQAFAGDRFEQQWPEIMRASGTLLTGCAVVALSARIASWLYRDLE